MSRYTSGFPITAGTPYSPIVTAEGVPIPPREALAFMVGTAGNATFVTLKGETLALTGLVPGYIYDIGTSSCISATATGIVGLS